MSARRANPLSLALFWLGIQAVWGALLGISLQSRTIELVSSDALIAYGRLATIGAVVAAVTQLLVGFLSDSRRRRGSRRLEFYLVGAAGGAAGIAFFYGAGSFTALVVSYVVLQAALNLAIGPYQAIIPDFVERARTGIASSAMAALQSAGNAAGALAASFITSARGLAATLDVLLLGTCLVTCAHVRDLPLSESAQETQNPPRVTRAFVDLFISRALIYIGFYTLLGYLLFYVNSVLAPATLASARMQTGIIIVGFTLVGAAGAALAARPSDRLDKRIVATAGAAAFIGALAIFIASSGIAGIGAATLVAGLGWGAFLVADWAIACRLLPAGSMAAAMGIWNLAIVVPQIVAPALTTAVLAGLRLSGNHAAPRVAFALALLETLVGAAWLWRLPKLRN
jgi:MFS family permease